MKTRVYYDLKTLEGNRFYLTSETLTPTVKELETFLKSSNSLHSKTFAKKVLFTQEIQANNQVEGYGDDIEVIKRVIKNAEAIKDPEKRARILNLYHAYNYILEGHSIDQDSLRELYNITSKDLLSQGDLDNMGDYYREDDVFIYYSSRADVEPDKGVPAGQIDRFMDAYFKFLENDIHGDETEEYIKSQILHFYFIYIHPYFDVNGRTSRTLAMWYLLSKRAYPFIIFNRGISFNQTKYYKSILNVKRTCDMTYFIELMLKTVKTELEKEYVMQLAADKATYKLEATDYQSLLYFLSIKNEKNVLNFASTYNRQTRSDNKSVSEIYEDMIVPLLDKGILDEQEETKKVVNENLKIKD